MNIFPESTWPSVRTSPSQPSAVNLTSQRGVKPTQHAAQTAFQRFSSILSHSSSQLQIYATQISPSNILASSAQAIKGIGKLALFVSFLSSNVFAVGPTTMSITAPAAYNVVPGSSVTLTNPLISIAVTWSSLVPVKQQYVECDLTLSLPLKGRLFLSTFSTPNNYTASFFVPQTLSLSAVNKDAINAALQHLMFEGMSMDIASTLSVYCLADGSGRNQVRSIQQLESAEAGPVIVTLSGKYQPTATTVPTTNAIPPASPLTQAPVSTTTYTTTSAASLTLATTTRSKATQSTQLLSDKSTALTLPNLLVSTMKDVSELTQSDLEGMFTISATLPNPQSEIETQIDTLTDEVLSMESPLSNDLDRYGWIVIAIGSVVCICSGLALGLYVKHKRSNKNKQSEPEQGITLPKSNKITHASNATTRAGSIPVRHPSVEANQVNLSQRYNQFPIRVSEAARVPYGTSEDLARLNNAMANEAYYTAQTEAMNGLNPLQLSQRYNQSPNRAGEAANVPYGTSEDLARLNYAMANGAHYPTQTLAMNGSNGNLAHGYSSQAPGIGQAPRARYLNEFHVEKGRYDDPMARKRELEMNPPSDHYIGVNELQVPV